MSVIADVSLTRSVLPFRIDPVPRIQQDNKPACPSEASFEGTVRNI